MKKIVNPILVIFFLAIGLSLNSCKEEVCDKLNCAYSGVCDETTGTCICEVGYEGIHCAEVSRDKFVNEGVYSVDETGTFTPNSQYTAVVTTGPRINEVLLKNLRNGILQGGEVLATVSHDTMWIAPQTVNGYEIEGMGIIEGINPVSGAEYQDAQIKLTYKTTNLTTNIVDYYGTNGSNPSKWNKN